jgi:hypothetical protein
MRFWSNKPLNPNVTITAGVNDTLELNVGGVAFVVALTAGVYKTDTFHTTSELIPMINDCLIREAVPAEALLGGIHEGASRNVLVLDSASDFTVAGSAYGTIIGSQFVIS